MYGEYSFFQTEGEAKSGVLINNLNNTGLKGKDITKFIYSHFDLLMWFRFQ